MPKEPKPWALAPDKVWTGSQLLESHVVVVQSQKIIAVKPAEDLPAELPVTTMAGCTLLPGLIDCHVHLSDWMFPGLLAAGVTTVRDTGNDLAWIIDRRSQTSVNPSFGPRILCCGPVLDGTKVNWPTIGRSHRDAVQIAESIDELARAGVDAVKLYVNLGTDQISKAVEQSAIHGLHLLAHLGDDAGEAAISLGVREIEHLSGCLHHVDGWSHLDIESAPFYSSIVNANVILCPTLVVWDRLSRVNDAVFNNDQRAEWVHPEIRSAWQAFPHRTGDTTERLARQASVVAMKKTVRAIKEAGCTIIAGTDTPWPNLVPGFSLHDELALLVDAGLSPSEALVAGTSAAAKVLGIGESAGQIRAGFVADLLAVEGDPTTDITNLGNVKTVIRMGESLDMELIRSAARSEFDNPPSDPVSRLIIEFSDQ